MNELENMKYNLTKILLPFATAVKVYVDFKVICNFSVFNHSFQLYMYILFLYL